jgi:hypothetical protein
MQVIAAERWLRRHTQQMAGAFSGRIDRSDDER